MFNWVKEDRRVFDWIPVLLWASVILVFSVFPYGNLPPITVGKFDKIAHFFEYTVLAVLLTRVLSLQYDLTKAKNHVFALILSGGYGILMELIQRVVPGRDADIYDVLSNFAGVACGLIIAGYIIRWRK